MAKVFISYAHQDIHFRELLESHLSTLGLGLDLEAVSDQDIEPGSDFRKELQRSIDGSAAGILILSNSYLKSRWCHDELHRMCERQPPLLLLPVLARACAWQDVPTLEGIQLVNRKPAQEAESQEGTWLEISRKIATTLKQHFAASPTEIRFADTWMDEWARIRKSAIEGRFTPFLGPGCYEGPERRGRAKQHILTKLAWMLESIGEDAPAWDFASGIASEILKDEVDRKSLVPQKAPEPRALLTEFQAGLARLGAACCTAIGSALSKHPRGFTDLARFAVDLDSEADSREGEALLNRFFESTYLAAAIYKKEGLRRDLLNCGLGIRGVLEQLVMLTYSAFYTDLSRGRSSPLIQQWRSKFQDLLRSTEEMVRPSDPPEGPRLSLSHLEWIGALLWHTLRFEAPMYPSPQELAFQISICLDTSIPPRKERVSTVAELAEGKERVELIRRWFQFYARSSAATPGADQGLYDALARSLTQAKSGTKERDSRTRRDTAGESSQRHGSLVPIAITTNFDQELECALDRYKQPYHVLFPVYLQTPSDRASVDSEPPLDWLLRTFDWDDDGEPCSPTDELLDGTNLSKLNDDLKGALVIKLHGSPLHRLISGQRIPKRSSSRGDSVGLVDEHRISLSDFDFIKSIVSQTRFWPPGLQTLLGINQRVVCLIGYSLGDAGSRLRLAEHLGGDASSRTLYLIDFPEDRVRHALLKRIHVGLIKSTIEQLTRRLLEWFPVH